jgi:hypothetical protein
VWWEKKIPKYLAHLLRLINIMSYMLRTENSTPYSYFLHDFAKKIKEGSNELVSDMASSYSFHLITATQPTK